ncbi:DUF961 family protein [Streptococcus suis]|uniref:DUF961 family protein n=1 Tax=Streptococcus suis TaxID=1307 RepID=UPI001557F5E6|nr:DUF961 family protein [Streptococcus suis]MBL6440638.1 DUF961 family protein [Streptococcus suis]MBM7192444.1 DUF961 family protein [Streptococcus suis]MCO8184439.1 DUF961 family protein [Streptococcus suis]MCO8215996.1 DUF961 family protein [Streptococcus suis]MCO8224413.1 DUF961 family protein [Streptococcus suis]
MAVKGLGIDLGERQLLAGKKHEVVDEYVDVQASLGKLTFIGLGNAVTGEEEVEVNGRMETVNTGDIIGYEVNVYSERYKQPDTVTLLDHGRSDLEALGIQFDDEVELIAPSIAISRMSRGRTNLKLYAGGIRKKGNAPQPKADQIKKDQPNEHKG